MKISGKIISGLTIMVVISFSSDIFAQPSTPSVNAGYVAALYDWFLNGNIPGVLDAMDPDIEWNSAENSSYADDSPYIGPTAVLEGVIYKLGSEWEYWTLTDLNFYETLTGEVIVTGRYNGKYKKTGTELNAQFVHMWWLKDNKVKKFQEYTDTYQVNKALE
jgi:ketosteroid isomerase-like protein